MWQKNFIFGTLFVKRKAYFERRDMYHEYELFLTSSGILLGGRAGIIYITKANRRILAEKYRME